MRKPILNLLMIVLICLSSCGRHEEIVLEAPGCRAMIDYLHLGVTLVTPDSDTLQISAPTEVREAAVERTSGREAVIQYPALKKKMTFRLDSLTLHITIESFENDRFTWPVLTKFDALTIPFHQGKYIPATDTTWTTHLNGRSYPGMEGLSMQFLAPVTGRKAAVFMITNPFNNEIRFHDAGGRLAVEFEHEYPATVDERSYGFIIHITDASPTAIAKSYRKYVMETRGITTLEEKAVRNPNIRKLYGAAHFYVWSDEFLSAENIRFKELIDFWKAQLAEKGSNPSKHLFSLFGRPRSGSGNEFLNQWKNIVSSSYLNKWQTGLIVRSLNEVLSYRNFYDEASWRTVVPGKWNRNELNDIRELNETALYRFNKLAFYAAFGDYTQTIDHWGNGVSLDMLNEMQEAGIHRAWLGLNEWKPAFIHPGFVKKAVELGYLIAPYDSYHCIHEPGKEQWTTAAFDDPGLYETATVTDKNGKKARGFLGIGRKLNPTLAFPAVQRRVEGILGQGMAFNSWFVDCDGTGEFLDDYTPGRMTSQEDDMNARLKRMAWLSREKKMVVGTEVGNDFCAGVIAFAHGMTTPVIAWSDPDMRKNKDSEYYTGSYFSITGGVPSKFSKEVPVKPIYRYVYLDPRFNLPLFQLVYNNSVITSHHWEWGTLKIPALRREREIAEILYNVPPLYHIDRQEWAKHKNEIIHHVREFSQVHSKAVKMEMLSVDFPDETREIQVTRFGMGNRVSLELTANFSTEMYRWMEWDIPPLALLIRDLEEGTAEVYVPE